MATTMKTAPQFVVNRPPKIEMLVKPYMVKKATENPRRYDIFHPSAWGYCLRKIAYQFYNEQQKFLPQTQDQVDVRMERVYDNGHGVHARWHNYLSNSGFLRGWWKCLKCDAEYGTEDPLGIFSPEKDPEWACACGQRALEYEEVLVKSDPQYNFEGHVDAVLDVRGSVFEQGNDFDLFLCDFKTIKDEYFSELREAKYEHVIQVHIYMWILGINGAVVLYENKDNQHIKEMFVPRDEKIISQIKEQAVWLVEVLRHRKLPPRPDGFSLSKFPCRMCEFRKICYA